MNEVIDCLIKGVKPGEKYPPSVRAFCMSLHYTSPKAYLYVREKFGKNIPHPDTIREWYRNSDLDATPGIGKKSMDALQKKAEQMKQENGEQLIVSLLMDEMAIQRNMTWCRATNKFIGLADYGSPATDDEFTLAENVIVFMACGVNFHFQQPVAYYFIKTLKAEDRVELVLQILKELSKRGITVSNLTFDGYSSNALMSKQLGANFTEKNGEYKTFFINPHNDRKMYIMYDPSHMEKLVRNILGSLKTLYAGEDKIEWKYFVELVKFSRQQNFGLTHKMNKRHIEWEYRKMHVRTAVETLSSSTADAMEFLLKNGVAEFANAAPTIEFIRIFDTLWDIMNTQRVKNEASNIFKSALNTANKNQIFTFLDKAKKYILSLEVTHPQTGKRVNIVRSDWKTGFRGFVIDILSLKSMYTELVEENHWLSFFATYRISQDHLEMFFGKIRAMNGNSDNPMAHQFTSAYRKLLHQSDITLSVYANVTAIASSNILTVASFQKRRPVLQSDINEYRDEPEYDNQSFLMECASNEANEFLEYDQISGGDYLSDSTQDTGIVYMANCIERQLTTCGQVHCEFCIKVLANNKKIDNRMRVNLNFISPCLSTYHLCKVTDTALKMYMNSGPALKKKVYMEILNNMKWESIFPLFYDSHHDADHKHFLVKYIVDEYINKKCSYIAKQKTLDLQKKYLRNKLRKLCHNVHQ